MHTGIRQCYMRNGYRHGSLAPWQPRPMAIWHSSSQVEAPSLWVAAGITSADHRGGEHLASPMLYYSSAALTRVLS